MTNQINAMKNLIIYSSQVEGPRHAGPQGKQTEGWSGGRRRGKPVWNLLCFPREGRQGRGNHLGLAHSNVSEAPASWAIISSQLPGPGSFRAGNYGRGVRVIASGLIGLHMTGKGQFTVSRNWHLQDVKTT